MGTSNGNTATTSLREALVGDGSAATKIEVVQTAPDSAKQALLGSSAGNTTMLKLLDQATETLTTARLQDALDLASSAFTLCDAAGADKKCVKQLSCEGVVYSASSFVNRLRNSTLSLDTSELLRAEQRIERVLEGISAWAESCMRLRSFGRSVLHSELLQSLSLLSTTSLLLEFLPLSGTRMVMNTISSLFSCCAPNCSQSLRQHVLDNFVFALEGAGDYFLQYAIVESLSWLSREQQSFDITPYMREKLVDRTAIDHMTFDSLFGEGYASSGNDRRNLISRLVGKVNDTLAANERKVLSVFVSSLRKKRLLQKGDAKIASEYQNLIVHLGTCSISFEPREGEDVQLCYSALARIDVYPTSIVLKCANGAVVEVHLDTKERLSTLHILQHFRRFVEQRRQSIGSHSIAIADRIAPPSNSEKSQAEQDAERMHERLNPFTADTLGASGSHEERKDKDPAPQINLESLFDNEVAAQVGTEPAKYKEHDQNHGNIPEAKNEGPTTRSTRDPEHEGVREKFKTMRSTTDAYKGIQSNDEEVDAVLYLQADDRDITQRRTGKNSKKQQRISGYGAKQEAQAADADLEQSAMRKQKKDEHEQNGTVDPLTEMLETRVKKGKHESSKKRSNEATEQRQLNSAIPISAVENHEGNAQHTRQRPDHFNDQAGQAQESGDNGHNTCAGGVHGRPLHGNDVEKIQNEENALSGRKRQRSNGDAEAVGKRAKIAVPVYNDSNSDPHAEEMMPAQSYGGRGKAVEPRPVQGLHENEHEGADGPNRSKLKELKKSKRKKEGKDKEKKKGKKKRNHGAGYESWAAVQLDSKQGNEMSNPLQQDSLNPSPETMTQLNQILQKMSEDTTKHARRKVQQVIEEAIQESDKILMEAQKEVDNIEGRTVQSARDQLRQFHERAEELEEQADDAQEAYKKTMRSILEAYEELSEEASGFEAEFEKSLKDAEEEMSKTMDQVANDLNTKAEGVNAKLNSVEKRAKARTNSFENMMNTV